MSNASKRAARKALAALLIAAVCIGGYGGYAHGAESGLSVRQQESIFNVMQGDVDTVFSLNLLNESDRTFSDITAEVGSAGGFENCRLVSGATSIAPRETATYFFRADIRGNASPGNVILPVTFYYGGGTRTELARGEARFNVGRSVSTTAGYDLPLVDLAYKLPGDELEAGKSTELTLTLTNRGNVMLNDIQVSLELPEQMRIDGGFLTQYVNYLAVADDSSVRFPIFVEEKAENRHYQITAHITARARGASASFDRAISLPVVGGVESTSSQAIEIGSVSLPQEAAAGDDFTLRFNVSNTGKSDVENIRVEASGDEGLVNRTKNIFVEPILKPGESKEYSVTFFSAQGAPGQRSYAVKMGAAASGGAEPAAQYASIFITKESTPGAVKTPQLIIDSYGYGGAPILAGGSFELQMGMLNTSAVKLSNIKVSLRSDTGAFIPLGGSSSFYIDSIEAKSLASKTLRLSVNPAAEQKTTALNVEMTYENEDGESFSAADVISIPVIQTTSLTVDDIIGPPELYQYSMAGLDVRFYNTGKTTLSNLRVTAEGNFDVVESINYYAGNMQSGASDTYSFSFNTREAGPLEGKVLFTYEDPSGEEQSYEKDFSFQVMEMPDMGDGMEGPMMDMPEEGGGKIKYIVGGAAIFLIAALIVLRRFLKKRKMHKEMEIDE
ncbi:MAG: hypothetical protein LBH39_07920 [Clostridiales Family XIII bacterium]|nr:hypothetical protein [Clostridiales Family XIII bacterium]